MKPTLTVSIVLGFASLFAGCEALSMLLPTSDNYGAECTTDNDCTSSLRCVSTPRAESDVCLVNDPGDEGATCLSYLECNSGLRCDPGTGNCVRGGLGLPECDDDADCTNNRVCSPEQTCEDP